jgi:ribonucleoside-diphosphate reductase alpha chain
MSEQEISVPTLRNDGDTLQERMTENAYQNILPARYMKKNENGEVVEEQEEVFERVAKNIAVAEAAFTDEATEHIDVDAIHSHFSEEDIDDYDLGYGTIPLNEKTARYFSYDGLVEHLSDSKHKETLRKMNFWKNEFQKYMEKLALMPNSPTLMNAGDELQQLAACFTLHPEDDMEHIHQEITKGALVQQSGGGIGMNFGELRPYGDVVGSSGGISSGPISFMRSFDQMCSTIRQGGTRRGAMMGMLDMSHPDIPLFLHAKNKDVSLAQVLLLNDPDDHTNNSFAEALEEARALIDEGKVPNHLRNAAEGHLSNFNISAVVDDEFMQCLRDDEEYTMVNPRTNEPHIATEYTEELYSWFDLGEYVEVGEELSIPASVLWDHVISGAWENGEPGVFFVDTANKEHAFDIDKHPEREIRETNPCGEIAMETYDACNLMHINLSTIVHEDAINWKDFHDEATIEDFLSQAIDWSELENRISVGTRFLDNVITMSDYPVEEIDETVDSMRRIGLGIMGLAQLFVQLGVEYGSEESNEIARTLMKYINHESKNESRSLAQERGKFDLWEQSKFANPTEYPEWFEKHVGKNPDDWEDGFPIRNMNTTMIAPCGTTGMVSNTTGGCEPIYNVAFYKNVSEDIQGDEMLVEFDNLFLQTLKENGIDVSQVKKETAELMENNQYEVPSDIPSVPDDVADLFVTTTQLEAKDHASVQCALQEGVDSSISKTTNSSFDSTVEDAKEVFEYIYENGGKAVTYYRDGSRTKQVKTTRKDNQEVDENEENDERENEIAEESIEYKSPQVADSTRYRIPTGYGNLLVHVTENDNGDIVEVVGQIGKSGGIMNSTIEAVGRLTSKSLQHGLPPEEIVSQLKNIRSPEIAWYKGNTVNSIPEGFSIALEEHLESGNTEKGENKTERKKDRENPSVSESDDVCLECGAGTIKREGCESCPECGWSKC